MLVRGCRKSVGFCICFSLNYPSNFKENNHKILMLAENYRLIVVR